MNEQLFIDAAKIRANRSSSRALTRRAGNADIGPRGRQALAFAAALLVNVAVLGTLQWSAANARYLPKGEVLITQLDNPPQIQLAKN